LSTNSQQPKYPMQQWRTAAPPTPTMAAPQPALSQVATMRASHADRERTVDVLKAAYAEGRLTPDEYNDRVELVYRALTYGQLSGIVQDLPSGPMPVPYLTPAPVIPAAFVPYPPAYEVPSPYAHGRPYDPYANPFAPPPRYRRTNGLAVAALILGVTEIFTLGLTALPALICGHLSKGQIRERDEDGEGMAVTGIVLGWLGVALWLLLIFLGIMATGDSGASSGTVGVPPLPPGG
jgi:Domain of unknown function (DUF4190)/Domain of unknown function (DUF1707)